MTDYDTPGKSNFPTDGSIDAELIADGGPVTSSTTADAPPRAQRTHPTDLTLFQQEILYYLAEQGPDYGLGIKEGLADRYDEDINHGRLYPNLDELVELDLIDKRALDKRTNEYALTDDAIALLDQDATRRAEIAEVCDD